MTQLNQIGEIVSWTAPSKVRRADLLVALNTAGLSEDMAPEMLPRNAFKRAVRGLEEGRIIRQCEEDADEIAFQFTGEFLQNGEYEYTTECFVRVNKTTGDCMSKDTAMAVLAHDKLVEKMEERTASDITRMIQSLFKRKADIFSVREAGGCYFVPQAHIQLVEQVEELLDLIGGGVRRFEISNTQNAAKSAAQAVNDQLTDLVTEFHSYLEMLNSESPQQVTVATKRIGIIKAKAETYKDLLGDYSASFKDAVAKMNSDLMTKLGVEPEPVPAEVLKEEMEKVPGAKTAADILSDLIAQTQAM